jgi:hypothetical protein
MMMMMMVMVMVVMMMMMRRRRRRRRRRNVFILRKKRMVVVLLLLMMMMMMMMMTPGTVGDAPSPSRVPTGHGMHVGIPAPVPGRPGRLDVGHPGGEDDDDDDDDDPQHGRHSHMVDSSKLLLRPLPSTMCSWD